MAIEPTKGILSIIGIKREEKSSNQKKQKNTKKKDEKTSAKIDIRV